MKKTMQLLALMLCVACGGQTGDTSTIVEPVDVTGAPAVPQTSSFDYMPADTFGYVEVSVARGLSSPYFAMIRDASDQSFTPEQRAVRDSAVSLAELVDQVYLSFGRNESGTDLEPGIAVIEGRFTIQNVIDFVAVVEPSEVPQRTQVGTFEAATVDDVTMINVGDGRFLFGPTARCTALALNPPRSGFHTRPFFTEAEGRIDAEAIFRVISEMPPGVASLNRDIDSELGEGIAARVRGGAFSADALDGARFRGAGLTADVATAQAIEAKLNELRQMALQQPMLNAFGLRSIVEAINISSDASGVSASLEISDSEVRRLFQMGMGLLNMGAAAATTAVAPAP